MRVTSHSLKKMHMNNWLLDTLTTFCKEYIFQCFSGNIEYRRNTECKVPYSVIPYHASKEMCTLFDFCWVWLWPGITNFTHIHQDEFIGHPSTATLKNVDKFITWIYQELITQPKQYKVQQNSVHILWDMDTNPWADSPMTALSL